MVKDAIREERPIKEIIQEVKEAVSKTSGIQEHETAVMVRTIWTTGTESIYAK